MVIGGHGFYANPVTLTRVTAIGAEIAHYAASGCIDDTLVGYQAGYNLGAGTGRILIGKGSGYDATGDYQLYIDSTGQPPTRAYIYGDMASLPRTFELGSGSADVGAPDQLRSGPTIKSKAHYWNGSVSTEWSFALLHTMDNTNPQSTVDFQVNAISLLKLRQNNGTPLVLISNLPTSDPGVVGALYRDGANVKVSL